MAAHVTTPSMSHRDRKGVDLFDIIPSLERSNAMVSGLYMLLFQS